MPWFATARAFPRESGHALELDTSAGGVYGWLSNHHATYGFKRTVPSEKWP